MSKYCHTICPFICWFLVFLYMNKKSIFCTGSCTVVQKKSVSRICAPVKMQINLFVRSMGFVSAFLGVVHAAPHQWEWSLQSAGERTSAVAKCPVAIFLCWD